MNNMWGKRLIGEGIKVPRAGLEPARPFLAKGF